MMSTSLKEMRYTAKVFGDYNRFKKVTVFGSARTQPEEKIYDMARQIGKRLAKSGYMVITGGGPGIMQAVHEGTGTEYSFGVNINTVHLIINNDDLSSHSLRFPSSSWPE